MIALAPPDCVSPALSFGNETGRTHCKEGRKGEGLTDVVFEFFWNHRNKLGFSCLKRQVLLNQEYRVQILHFRGKAPCIVSPSQDFVNL